MTGIERTLQGLGLSLLLHAVLAGAAAWLWVQSSHKPRPDPLRWEVSLVDPVPPVPAFPPAEEPPPPPDSAPEPALTALPQPDALPPAPATVPAAGAGMGIPGPALPAGGAIAGAVAIPVTGISGWSTGLAMAGTGSASPAGAAGGNGLNVALAPIVQIPPTYPLEARRRKIEGWVRMEFTVLANGSVADVKVRKAEPAGVFEQAAMAAIAQWKFRPAMENGKPARQRAGQTLRFQLEQ